MLKMLREQVELRERFAKFDVRPPIVRTPLRDFALGERVDSDQLDPYEVNSRISHPSRRKGDLSRFTGKNAVPLEMENTDLLNSFVSETGKILSRRFSMLTSKDQRKVSKTIKRARHWGFFPYDSRFNTLWMERRNSDESFHFPTPGDGGGPGARHDTRPSKRGAM